MGDYKNYYKPKWFTKFIKFSFLLFLIAFSSGLSFAIEIGTININISSCQTISIPGTYLLNISIFNHSGNCFNITTSNVTLNCEHHIIQGNFTGSGIGIYVNSSGSLLKNITIVNCNISEFNHGIIYDNVTNSLIKNVISNDNLNAGFSLHQSSSNTFTNITSNSNNAGFFLYQSSENILTNSIIFNNSQYGIYINSSSNNNVFYNNLFNNTKNVYFSNTSLIEQWNTTKQTKTNIVDGPYIGGNYWGKPNDTGYSDTCTDANKDGLCDSPYTLNSNNIDYLPLAKYNKVSESSNPSSSTSATSKNSSRNFPIFGIGSILSSILIVLFYFIL